MSSGPTNRILILGGGFAGLYTAMELEKTMARDPGVEVTLVNRENFFLFTPMLHEVAASDLDLTAIVNPLRKMLKRANFFEGEVEAIDLSRKEVIVSHGFDHHQHSRSYDQLVIGLGSITNLYELPGLDERTLTMKSLGDAIRLRNQLIARLEEADSECVTEKNPLLTFVVAGGGFAGVETVGSLNDFVRQALPSYSHLSEAMLRVVLVHAGAVILPELGEKLGAFAQRKLARRGVEIHVNTKVHALPARGVQLVTAQQLRATRWSGLRAIRRTRYCRSCRARKNGADLWLTSSWRSSGGLGCGRWAIARQSRTVPQAKPTLQPLSMRSAREKSLPGMSALRSEKGQRGPSCFRPSASLRRSESEPASPIFWESSSLASSPGGFGERFT
jgi:Pyridine nucleotide-disulphide oxidoreductase